MVSIAVSVCFASIAVAQYPTTSNYPATNNYQSTNSQAPQGGAAPQYSQPQYAPSQPYSQSQYGQPENGQNQSAPPQYTPPQYSRETQRQQTTPQQPAPVVEGNSWGRPQSYNQSYTRSVGDQPADSGWNRSSAPQADYPANDSLGPYNDYRQQQQFQPDFRQTRPEGPPAAQKEPFSPGQMIAIVVDEPILAGDLLGDINQMLAPYEGKATEEQLEEQRQLLMQKLLPQAIQTKMLYQQMLASVPAEALPQIKNKLADEFDDKQLPILMERAKVNTPAELDAKLREFGSSIAKQRRSFAEQILAREFVRSNVDSEPDVSHVEMVRYYRENASEYDRPERVRWEELAVRFDQFNSKGEAYRAIANMGNRILRGAAFSRVAREESQGFTADNGGWHDWTLRDTLKASEVEEAIFSLPLDQLSQIIETDFGFHIFRVLDRAEEGRKPFFQEQASIKAKLQKEKRDVAVDAFIADLRSKTRVWTIFDDQPLEQQ